MNQPTKDIVSLIDHAILHPTATDEDLIAGCELAVKLGVASVCVKPYMIRRAVELIENAAVGVGTVIGFPHGSNSSMVKAAEAEQACLDGATELDMVVNVARVLENDWDYVTQDIATVHVIARSHQAILKVIFETDYLEDQHITKLCDICSDLQVDFVKTSTGFGYTKRESGDYNYTGATIEHIKLMLERVVEGVQVKASGGIRTYDDAKALVDLGVTRLGTSASQAIADGGVGESY